MGYGVRTNGKYLLADGSTQVEPCFPFTKAEATAKCWAMGDVVVSEGDYVAFLSV